jgi:hypothetical protein
MLMVMGGRFHPVAGGDLARFIGYPNADFGVLDYLVLNHLAVILRANANSLDISLNAQDSDAANMRALIEHVSRDTLAQRFCLRSFLGGWLTEKFGDKAAVVARLRQIAGRELSPPSERRRNVPQDPAARCTLAGKFSALAQHHDRVWDRSFTEAAERADLLGRVFVMAPDRRDRWSVSFIGRDIDIFGAWRAQSAGSPLASLANDQEYVGWCEEHYRDAALSADGRLDHVDALVAVSGPRPNRLRYRRRLIPFASLDGRPLVVGYSISSNDLALPL